MYNVLPVKAGYRMVEKIKDILVVYDTSAAWRFGVWPQYCTPAV
jgi:hypothetical protein